MLKQHPRTLNFVDKIVYLRIALNRGCDTSQTLTKKNKT